MYQKFNGAVLKYLLKAGNALTLLGFGASLMREQAAVGMQRKIESTYACESTCCIYIW